MEDYLYLRLLFWFALVFAIAYLFLLIDLSIRASCRIDRVLLKRILVLLKKVIGSKEKTVRTID